MYWVHWLVRIQADARMKDAMRGEAAGLQAVTAAGVQASFRDHIAPRPPVEVVTRAAGSAVAAN